MYYIIKDHKPFTDFKSAIQLEPVNVDDLSKDERLYGVDTDEEDKDHFHLLINGEIVLQVREYIDKDVTVPMLLTIDSFEALKNSIDLLSTKEEFPLPLKNFRYDGFGGQALPGKPSYRGKFVDWTSDPGIVRVACSDGQERLIPTYAIDIPWLSLIAPQPEPKAAKTLFGVASHS